MKINIYLYGSFILVSRRVRLRRSFIQLTEEIDLTSGIHGNMHLLNLTGDEWYDS